MKAPHSLPHPYMSFSTCWSRLIHQWMLFPVCGRSHRPFSNKNPLRSALYTSTLVGDHGLCEYCVMWLSVYGGCHKLFLNQNSGLWEPITSLLWTALPIQIHWLSLLLVPPSMPPGFCCSKVVISLACLLGYTDRRAVAARYGQRLERSASDFQLSTSEVSLGHG